MNRMRDELFAGPGLATNQHGRVRAGHLRHLLVHLPHRPARADDVREVVALAELLPQMGVLVFQAAAVLFDEPLNLDRLGQHRRHDAEELAGPVVVAVRLELQIDGQGADCLAIERDRDAHETQLLLRELRTLRRSMQQEGLAARAGNDNGPAGFDHAARDALANAVLDRRTGLLESVGGFHAKLAALLRQRDNAPHRAVMPREDFEHVVHGRFQVQRPRKRLTDVE